MNQRPDRGRGRPGDLRGPPQHATRGRGSRPASGQRRDREPRLDILHEEPGFIVVDKPPGMVSASPVDGKRGRKPTAFDHLQNMLSDRDRRRPRLIPVQHLDKDASGVLVFAKTPQAAMSLGEAFRTRRAGRTYTALVCGEPPLAAQQPSEGSSGDVTEPPQAEAREDAPGEPGPLDAENETETPRPPLPRGGGPVGTIHTMLVEGTRGGPEVARIGSELDEGLPGSSESVAHRAVTHYRVQERGPALTLLRVRAETDYAYQVRAQLASVGCPVAGDRVYSAPYNPIRRVALHLGAVSFKHPDTGREVHFRRPAPDEFSEALAFEPPTEQTAKAAESGWDDVAEWYTELVSSGRSDLQTEVVFPGVLRLLDLREGQRLLDVACGPGDLAELVHPAGVDYTGVDAAPRLIEAARERFGSLGRFEVADATTLADQDAIAGGSFDAAACVLALMNIAGLDTACRGISAKLKPGGRVVAVVLHPAFRNPGSTSWGWEGMAADDQRQFRRVDAYLSESATPIVMNPGEAAAGEEPQTTTTHHRPISRYMNAFAAAGLLVDAIEEWPSHRVSEPGPRAREENRARQEIPMFLAIRARRASLPRE